jgi:ssDNA-binding Zn-finger/Zn-ribbon topoisomerase 1
MFFCSECGDKNGWGVGLLKSHGRCEICGKTSVCSDIASKFLPRKKEEYRTKTIEIQVRVCPDCDGDMREETDREARSMWHYICPDCNKKI